jgi:hypothetical protein
MSNRATFLVDGFNLHIEFVLGDAQDVILPDLQGEEARGRAELGDDLAGGPQHPPPGPAILDEERVDPFEPP